MLNYAFPTTYPYIYSAYSSFWRHFPASFQLIINVPSNISLTTTTRCEEFKGGARFTHHWHVLMIPHYNALQNNIIASMEFCSTCSICSTCCSIMFYVFYVFYSSFIMYVLYSNYYSLQDSTCTHYNVSHLAYCVLGHVNNIIFMLLVKDNGGWSSSKLNDVRTVQWRHVGFIICHADNMIWWNLY